VMFREYLRKKHGWRRRYTNAYSYQKAA
jgi:hypothetical protein